MPCLVMLTCECHRADVVMLSVTMLIAIMLSAAMQSDVMLTFRWVSLCCVDKLSAVMLSAFYLLE
jgi:hypothetical protein